MKFKILLTLYAFVFVAASSFAYEKNLFYISDNMYLSDSFDTKYTDMLQKFLDDEYGKETVAIQKFARFDMNTTESFEVVETMTKIMNINAVILMVGEANYHNLYGFSSYMTDKKYKDSRLIDVPKTINKINEEMAEIYNVKGRGSFFGKIFSAAYEQIVSERDKYKPIVIPDFYVLDSSFIPDNNYLSAVEVYRHAWSVMKDKNFDEARDFLWSVIKEKPSQSMLYYALGSTYLLEQKEGYEKAALKAFEDGILVDPFNKENICYKGLILMFMMYKGEITADVLFFAKALNSCKSNLADEITAITSINTSEYSKKISAIDSWILYDIDRIKDLCKEQKISLIFASYPADVSVNKTLEAYINETKDIFYINNDVDLMENPDFVIYRLSKNMFSFLKNNRILN